MGEQTDRDLKFFDEMLKSLRKDYKVDDKRVYATGHSNGGRFTNFARRVPILGGRSW